MPPKTGQPAMNDPMKVMEKQDLEPVTTLDIGTVDEPVQENADHLHRRLGNRQIQLIAIGGSIGTGLFVSIGAGLNRGGPLGLLLAFLWYSVMVALVNNGMAEMVTLFPVAGGFIRLAGEFVDDAFGFMAGWNFFLYQAFVIPFEISALAIVLSFWSDDIPIWAVCLVVIILYAILNMLAVGVYGEAEFWLSGGKVVLLFALFFFTFITMVGGNPKGDAYGFRYWRDPGPFAEYRTTGALGRWEGYLAAMWVASFSVVGPEYLSLIAAEAKRPRVYMKAAYKTIYYRFGLFYLGGALACGIVIAYNDPALVDVLKGSGSGSGTAKASPYVIAMQNLGIGVFPHVVNALLVTSIFSAGNTYVYCASRCLYGLSIEGRAPKVLQKTIHGVPIYCFAITMAFSFLSFLQVSPGTATALSVLIDFVTTGAFINYVIMAITYVFFYRACVAQKLDRKSLPYFGWFQPYCAYIASVFFILVVGVYGYPSFSPWDTQTFFSCYTMVFIAVITYTFWKVYKKTKLLGPHDVDLVWERPIIDAYESSIITPPVGFWTEMVQMFGFKRVKGGNDQRRASVAGSQGV